MGWLASDNQSCEKPKKKPKQGKEPGWFSRKKKKRAEEKTLDDLEIQTGGKCRNL